MGLDCTYCAWIRPLLFCTVFGGGVLGRVIIVIGVGGSIIKNIVADSFGYRKIIMFMEYYEEMHKRCRGQLKPAP